MQREPHKRDYGSSDPATLRSLASKGATASPVSRSATTPAKRASKPSGHKSAARPTAG
ncbi:hypothetical protein FHW69_001321 [Luteibacter sp. Sphag1AF]|uniref:hypothetical protein n=1 Tax=Luteibacter sp. Sphag1AF TaxID=2587031 RepID=UPI00160F4556|nr:hypothetical protein [Luteibacter sp. Sphag1AF]MBB3226731.1 hypothetical protein [Luteibacter sp. Sphag1AF]